MKMLTEKQHLIIHIVKINILVHISDRFIDRDLSLMWKTHPKNIRYTHLRLELLIIHIYIEILHLAFGALDNVCHLNIGQNVIRQTVLHSTSKLYHTFNYFCFIEEA